MIRWWWSATDIGPDLTRLETKLEYILERIKQLPTRSEIDSFKQELKAEIDLVVQRVSDLQQRLANGGQLTPADFEELKADLTELHSTDPAPPTP